MSKQPIPRSWPGPGPGPTTSAADIGRPTPDDDDTSANTGVSLSDQIRKIRRLLIQASKVSSPSQQTKPHRSIFVRVVTCFCRAAAPPRPGAGAAAAENRRSKTAEASKPKEVDSMTSRQPNSPAAADGVGPGGQRPSSLPGGGRRSRSGGPPRRRAGGGQENRHGLRRL